MNASNGITALAKKATGLYQNTAFHAKTVTLGVLTGTLTTFYPAIAAASGAPTRGLGESVADSTKELSIGFATALKVGGAVIGLGMIAYAIYGLTLGRKKDEREYPMGQTLLVGLGGAGLLGLTAAAGLFSASFFGGGSDGVGESFNLDLLEEGAGTP